jgi:cell division protein FtsW (lipid II flippase)
VTRVTTYVGMCVGGPKKGLRLETYQPTYQMARMGQFHRPASKPDMAWAEIDRGHYEFESGHWWWKGWALKR